MARSNTPASYKCSICTMLGHNARTCPTKGNAPSATKAMKEMRAEKRERRAAARKQDDYFIAPHVIEIESLLKEIEEDERKRDAADLEAAIAVTMPIMQEEPVMGMTVNNEEDADILAMLRSLGIDTSSVEGK